MGFDETLCGIMRSGALYYTSTLDDLPFACVSVLRVRDCTCIHCCPWFILNMWAAVHHYLVAVEYWVTECCGVVLSVRTLLTWSLSTLEYMQHTASSAMKAMLATTHGVTSPHRSCTTKPQQQRKHSYNLGNIREVSVF